MTKPLPLFYEKDYVIKAFQKLIRVIYFQVNDSYCDLNKKLYLIISLIMSVGLVSERMIFK